MNCNVVIVDDHESVISGIKQSIEELSGVSVIATYQDPSEAISQIPTLGADLIISDFSMGVMSGDDFVRDLRVLIPDIKIIMFTMHTDMFVIDRMLRLGVEGFVEKGLSTSELIKAVQMVAGGETYFSKGVHRYLNVMMKENGGKNRFRLTPREFDIVNLIAKEHTTKEISDLLHISKSTVETYRNGLLKKFDVRNAIGLVKKAMDLGLIK